jgi:hypothetical protein
MIVAKGALVDLLSSAEGLGGDGLQVSWSHPGRSIQKETIIVGRCRRGSQRPVTMRAGGGQREAIFTIEVAISVAKKGGVRDVAERTAEIADLVEAVIQANSELGQPSVIIDAAVADGELTDGPMPDGPEADLYLDVQVRARLHRVP